MSAESSQDSAQLLAGLEKLERRLGDGLTWTKGYGGNCLARAAAAVDDYYGRETTDLQAELCKTLGKPREYGWLMQWNDHPATAFGDVKKLIADTRERIRSEIQQDSRT